jgi:hypothetical protein
MMTECCDHHHGRASMVRWLSKRRARPCRHRLTGHLLPEHEKSVASCPNQRPPRANFPLQEGSHSVMRHLSSPLPSPCNGLLYPFAEHAAH